MNRSIFEINRGIDQLILRPIAELYRSALPDMVRNCIRSFVNNLETPNILIHDLLQGETERASDSLGRFVANTAAGPLGLRDVAAGDNFDWFRRRYSLSQRGFGPDPGGMGCEPRPLSDVANPWSVECAGCDWIGIELLHQSHQLCDAA